MNEKNGTEPALKGQVNKGKLSIKHLVQGTPEEALKWSKPQIKEALALLESHVLWADHKAELYYLVELHKRLLPIEPEICLSIGENLLKVLSSPLLDSSDKRVVAFRSKCYIYHWNSTNDETRANQHELNIQSCFLALKFSLVHSSANLSSVINKLKLASTFTQELQVPDVLVAAWFKLCETLEGVLCREYGGNVEIPKDAIVVLEESFVRLLLLLPRHFAKFPDYKGLKVICQRIKQIAKLYVPLRGLDLAITYICKFDRDFCVDNLAKYLHAHPSLLTSEFGIHDVFEYGTSHWKSWGQQWISLKKDNPDLEMVTVLNKLEEANLASDKVFVCKALRCELNSYFCSKAVLPDALLSAGEALKSCSTNFIDLALGNLAQGIGFWFGGETHEADALELCETAMNILNSSPEISKGNPNALILAAVSYTWIALSKQNQMRTRSTLELEEFEENYKAANPTWNKCFDTGTDDEMKSIPIPAISTLTLADEFDIAAWLKKSVDIMSMLIKHEDKIKSWVIESGCPSLIVLTMRLLAHLLTTLKDSVNSIKAWSVVFALSSHFPNKISRLISGAELMKQVPDLDPKLKAEIELSFKQAWTTTAEPILKSARPYLWRLEIAKATNALFTKNYDYGLAQLEPILDFRLEKDNHDIAHHIMAELYFLLAEYRSLDASLEIDFSKIPETLREMSASCLAQKAYEHLVGMARAPNFRQSGWSDILHNNGILSSIVQMAPRTAQMFKLSGRVPELRNFAADYSSFCIELGLVSSTVQVLVPLAESHLAAKSFDRCELNLVALHQLLSGKIEPKVDGTTTTTPLHRANIMATLKRCGISPDYYKKLVNIPDKIFSITSINMPDWHYSKGEHNEEKDGQNSPVIYKFRVPNFLFHSLQCDCYVCIHPVIIPAALQYLQILACYARHSQNSSSKDLMRAASGHHMRAMFSILHNFPKFQASCAAVVLQANGAGSVFNSIYLPFFFEPLVKSFLFRMELCETERMDLMLNAHKYYQKAYNQNDPKNIVEKHRSLEALTSAIFCNLYAPNRFEIEGSAIAEYLMTEVRKSVPSEHASARSPSQLSELEVDVSNGPPRRGARQKSKPIPWRF